MTILCSIDESKSCTSVQISRMESDRYEDSVGVPVPSRERDFVKNVSIWRQFRALVRRRTHLILLERNCMFDRVK